MSPAGGGGGGGVSIGAPIKFAEIYSGPVNASMNRKMPAPGPMRFGFYRFFWQQCAGPLRKINQSAQICFPDHPNATGFEVYPADGVTCGYRCSRVTSLSPDVTCPESPMNFMANQLAPPTGYASPVDGNWQGTNDSFQVHIPQFQGAPNTQTTPPIPEHDSQNGTYGGRALNTKLVLLGLACEIASLTVMADMAATTETFASVQNTPYITVTDGVMRNAQITITNVPSNADCKFGPTGLIYVGAWAFEYNGVFEEWQWINCKNQRMWPAGVEPTGLQIWLKPYVTANVTVGVNPYGSQGVLSSLGEINYLAGYVSNFLPAASFAPPPP